MTNDSPSTAPSEQDLIEIGAKAYREHLLRWEHPGTTYEELSERVRRAWRDDVVPIIMAILPILESQAAAALAQRDAEIAHQAKQLDMLEARGERYFKAFQSALTGHYDSVLWFWFTSGKNALVEKFHAWAKSDKNTLKPFDAEHWFKVFGLIEGDWQKAEPTSDLTDAAPREEAG